MCLDKKIIEDFNTTLVDVYRVIPCLEKMCIAHFNTTLVDVYQFKNRDIKSLRFISIQRLLMFIPRF